MLFFFFKQKTAYEIKECDWSSDVCSSDLPDQEGANLAAEFGYINVLEWMKKQKLPLPDQENIIWAAENGHIDVLEWMKEQLSSSDSILLERKCGCIRMDKK